MRSLCLSKENVEEKQIISPILPAKQTSKSWAFYVKQAQEDSDRWGEKI